MTDPDKDEIDIDFSKVKKFFKKKIDALKSEDIQPKDEGVNLSKVKSFFKRALSDEVEETKQEARKVGQALNTKIATEKKEVKILEQDKKILGEVKREIKEEERKAVVEEKHQQVLEKDIAATRQKVHKVEDDIDTVSFDKIKDSAKKIFDKGNDVNWAGVKKFFIKYQLVLLLLIPIIISSDLRLEPARLPVTDKWAEETMYNSLMQQLQGQVNQQYPNLPAQNKNAIVNNNVQQFIEQNKDQFEEQQRLLSENFKTVLQDEQGQTYLLAIDPWFWKHLAENVVENGHTGTTLKDGKPWDGLMMGPAGREAEISLHPYLIAYSFKFFRIFNSDISIMTVMFYFPVVIIALAIIPAFFIARRIGGNISGVVAGLLVGITPSLLTRTSAGFSDTDAYNVLFPLLITWLFLESFEAKTTKKTFMLGTLAGLFVGLFSFSWSGWWYIFDFIVGVVIVYAALYIFSHRKQISGRITNIWKIPAMKNAALTCLIFLAASAAFVSLFRSPAELGVVVKQPLAFVALKDVAITTVWPNVFTTVAEQNSASLNQIIGQIGGRLFLFLAVVGIVASFRKRDKYGVIDWKYPLILGIWFFSTMYAATKGIRFGLLMVPAFAMSVGAALGVAYQLLTKWLSEEMQVNKTIVRVGLIVLIAVLFITPLKTARGVAESQIPSMNDAWYGSLSEVREKMPENTIITSWWDFGHWFKAVAKRPVSFDGASQHNPHIHWVGNSLLTSDEATSVGILRMLDCSGREGGTDAFDYLFDIVKDHPKTIDQLYGIFPLSKEEARDHLIGSYTDEQVTKLLSFTHCDAPPAIYITSEDMVGKAPVWSHFGAWDFSRALIYNRLKSEYKGNQAGAVSWMMERFNLSQTEADNYWFEVSGIANSGEANSWITPWPSYQSSATGCPVKDAIATCTVNNVPLEISTEDFDVRIKLPDGGVTRPVKVGYPTAEGFEVRENEEGFDIGMTVWPDGDNVVVLFMHPLLVDSMFTRLFFLNGHGLSYYDTFTQRSSPLGNRILLWEVDWAGSEPSRLNEFQKPLAGNLYQIVVNSSTEANRTIKLLETRSFESVARDISLDNQTAKEGGFVQTVRLNDLPDELQAAIRETGFENPTKPFELNGGWIIVRFSDAHEIPYGASATYVKNETEE